MLLAAPSAQAFLTSWPGGLWKRCWRSKGLVTIGVLGIFDIEKRLASGELNQIRWTPTTRVGANMASQPPYALEVKQTRIFISTLYSLLNESCSSARGLESCLPPTWAPMHGGQSDRSFIAGSRRWVSRRWSGGARSLQDFVGFCFYFCGFCGFCCCWSGGARSLQERRGRLPLCSRSHTRS